MSIDSSETSGQESGDFRNLGGQLPQGGKRQRQRQRVYERVEYESDRPPQIGQCPICRGSTWTYERHDWQRFTMFRCRCAQQQTSSEPPGKLDDRGRYAQVSLEQFSTEHDLPDVAVWEESLWSQREGCWVDQTFSVDSQRMMLREAKRTVMEWAAKPRTWLYIAGSYGSGKTHLATAAINMLRLSGYRGAYESVPGILNFIREGFEDRTAGNRLNTLLTASSLMLDDLGAEHQTSWTEEQIFQIINKRDQQDLLTVITSNRPLSAIRGRLGSRLAGRCIVVELVAYDYRALHPPRQVMR